MAQGRYVFFHNYAATTPTIPASVRVNRFVFTFDQVEAALLLLRQDSYTLPIQLFLYMEKWQDPTIAVVSVVLIAFALALFMTIKLVLRSVPGLESLFGRRKTKGGLDQNE